MTRVVDTAIPFQGSDLEEPLITRNVGDHNDNNNDYHQHQEDDEDDTSLRIDDEVVKAVLHYFQMVGWTLGFLLQCVSLGATAVLALNWDDVPTAATNASVGSQTMYWMIFGLSNSWLLLFPVVCLAIERSWKVSGIRFLQSYLLNVNEPIVTGQTRRMTFVASVQFLVGVVLGCFMTWGLVDLYLGASFTMLLALVVSMAACLTLCQGMIIIYDSFAAGS